MSAPRAPWRADDPGRLAAVRRVQPPPSTVRALERLAELATRLLGAGAAEVCLVGDAQLTLAAAGSPGAPRPEPVPLTESLGAVAVAAAPEPLVVGDARSDPRTADLAQVRRGEVGSCLGVSFAGADGLVVGALCLHQPTTRAWSATDVFLVAELADSVASELQLTALNAEFEARRLSSALAVEAAGIGSFDLDLISGRLLWDAAMLRLFELTAAEFEGTIEGLMRRVHTADRARVEATVAAAVASLQPFDVEYRALLPSGGVRWLACRGRALGDASGRATRLLGASYDSSLQREGDVRLGRVLDSTSTAFYSLDLEGRFGYVNTQAERLLGRSRDELVGRVLWDLFPHAAGADFGTHVRRAVESGLPATFVTRRPSPAPGWSEVRVSPGANGLAVHVVDVTERRRAEEQAARGAARLSLIAEVTASFSRALDGGRDLEEPLGQLVRAVVPSLADFSIVSIVESDGRLRDVHSWHVEPGARELVAEYARLRLPGLTSTAPLVRALATGKVVEIRDVGATVDSMVPPGPITGVFRALAAQTGVVLPLVARGRTVGALTLYRTAARGRADAEDLATAAEVADRAALALDNARLYEQQRRMVEEMQRSVLTEPPQPAGMEIAVRYQPAVQAARVGGDWYDAFEQPDGATMVVIGDVVGHDSAAAAAMGQLRGLLRGLAYRAGAGPADVLGDLDRAVLGLRVGTMATAAIARLERVPGGRRLRWSSAGHPPLLVRHPDGRVESLNRDRPDVMLGVDPTAPRHEDELLLSPGSTVLLYTDGLVEGRDLPLDTGLDLLAAVLAQLGEAPLGDLCNRVLALLRPVGPQDDVALLAVRLT